MSVTMVTVFVRLSNPYFVLLLISMHLINSTPQVISKREKCPDVTFINRSKEYLAAAT